MSFRVYFAHSMSGRTGDDLLREAGEVGWVCWLNDVQPLDPIISEGVKPSDKPLANDLDRLRMYWKRDKAMIREAHVLIDVTGPAKSEGVAHEIGYARYTLWKPVIRVYPGLGPSIARLEDDIIAPSLTIAVKTAKELWGTRRQRILWRIRMLVKSLPKWLVWQLNEWK